VIPVICYSFYLPRSDALFSNYFENLFSLGDDLAQPGVIVKKKANRTNTECEYIILTLLASGHLVTNDILTRIQPKHMNNMLLRHNIKVQ